MANITTAEHYKQHRERELAQTEGWWCMAQEFYNAAQLLRPGVQPSRFPFLATKTNTKSGKFISATPALVNLGYAAEALLKYVLSILNPRGAWLTHGTPQDGGVFRHLNGRWSTRCSVTTLNTLTIWVTSLRYPVKKDWTPNKWGISEAEIKQLFEDIELLYVDVLEFRKLQLAREDAESLARIAPLIAGTLRRLHDEQLAFQAESSNFLSTIIALKNTEYAKTLYQDNASARQYLAERITGMLNEWVKSYPFITTLSQAQAEEKAG